MSKGLTSEHTKDRLGHQKNGQYDVAYQCDGSMDILDSDEDGNEFPAKAGWYYKQFVPAPWSVQEWMSFDGWFGPYESVDKMPAFVLDNLSTK